MIHNEKLSYIIFRDSTGCIKIMWGTKEGWGDEETQHLLGQRGVLEHPLVSKPKLGFFVPPSLFRPSHNLYAHFLFSY